MSLFSCVTDVDIVFAFTSYLVPRTSYLLSKLSNMSHLEDMLLQTLYDFGDRYIS